VTEVAPRARALLAEEQFRMLVESVRDYAIFLLDPRGHVQSWNEGARAIKGYEPEEIIGRHISVFYTPEARDAGRPQELLQLAVEQGRAEEEGWRVRRDGTRFWADVVITSAHDASGQLLGFTKVTRDLTDRRKMEEERLRLVQADEAVRLRDEFLSIASHELKTPLTALQLQLQMAHDSVQLIDDRQAMRLAKAMRAGDRLADLIEALLDVSRIATGKLTLNLEEMELADAVHEVADRVRDGVVRAGSELRINPNGMLRGRWDRLRVEQVMMNFLSNALKYAPGTPIEVTLSRDDKTAVVEVRDHGPGLPPEDLDRVFGRFERASDPGLGGLGLGLYITRQIAEAHGGSVTVRNETSGGACFTLRLPLL
jgi:PAS domain S-box-containing protein